MKTCKFKKLDEADDSVQSNRRQATGALMLPISDQASDSLKINILGSILQDEVTNEIRMDDLIKKFGSRQHFKHGHAPHRRQCKQENVSGNWVACSYA